MTQSKPEMAIHMMKRAKRCGIEAEYLIADAWFGTKTMIRAVLGLEMQAILRMKKNKMKYRAVVKGRRKELRNAQELYSCVVKQEWTKVRGLPWKAVVLDVELDLAEGQKAAPCWQAVRLLFVRGLKVPDDAEAGKKDWALFLTTDVHLSLSKMLEIYALRWGIEVYFKEAKQHLGFLAEQTATFASHTASIHLCAIRYLMLVDNKLADDERRVGDIRATIQEQLNALSFAGRLWQILRSIISGALHDLPKSLGGSEKMIMEKIDERVNAFFIRSLQLDAITRQREYE